MAIINIINEFTVSDIKKAVEFYKNNFNFEIDQTDNTRGRGFCLKEN